MYLMLIFVKSAVIAQILYIWCCIIGSATLDLPIGDDNLNDMNRPLAYVVCYSCGNGICTESKKCYFKKNSVPNCYGLWEINPVNYSYSIFQAGCYDSNIKCFDECGTSLPVVKTGPDPNIEVQPNFIREFCCCHKNGCNGKLETTARHKYAQTVWLSINTSWIMLVLLGIIVALIAYNWRRRRVKQTKHSKLLCDDTQLNSYENRFLIEQLLLEKYNKADTEKTAYKQDQDTEFNLYNNEILYEDACTTNDNDDIVISEFHVDVISKISNFKFGEYWVGVLRYYKPIQPIRTLIKFFHNDYTKYWINEIDRYTSYPLNHPNIHCFIGGATRDISAVRPILDIPLHFRLDYDRDLIQRSLFTHHVILEDHSMGSLYMFLINHTFNSSHLHTMVCSLIAGIEYLHSYNGTSSPIKPHILHKDLNPFNILIKYDGECVISDFTLAVSFFPDSTLTHLQLQQEGTKLYMAPEVIQGSIILKPDILLMIDIYSFALLLYDIISRCSDLEDYCRSYMLPFENELGREPPIYLLRDHVVSYSFRPQIPESWMKNLYFGSILNIVQECWNEDPEARLSASAIRHKLSQLYP